MSRSRPGRRTKAGAPARAAEKDARPLRTDGAETRGRILESAGILIAQAGFADTTSKAIAQRAGVDLASINYHFGSRAGLYQAVLVEAHGRLVSIERLDALRHADLPPREKLARLIDGLLTSVTDERGWHAAVLSRELLAPSSHMRALMENEVAAKAEIALAILSEITGRPRDDPALLPSLISVIAPCAMLLVAGRGFSPLTEEIFSLPHDRLVDHLVRFAMGGLTAVAR